MSDLEKLVFDDDLATMLPQPTFNHLLSIAAQIDTPRDAESLTPQEIREAFLKRLASLTDDELMEAIDVDDTIESE